MPAPYSPRGGGGSGAGQPQRDEAVALLFRAHYRDLVGLAVWLLGDRAQAEDAVQDAFCSVYRHWERLRDPAAAHGYLRAAVVNRCRSGVRALIRERNHSVLDLSDAQPPTPDEAAVADDDRDRMIRAVRGLPTRQREVVVCRYYLDLSVAETAALLGVSEGSVKRHAHRGVAALVARMEVEAP